MLLDEAALGNLSIDSKIVNMDLAHDENDIYTTEEGYGIFKTIKTGNNRGIVVIKDETNVRVKYLVEIKSNKILEI